MKDTGGNGIAKVTAWGGEGYGENKYMGMGRR